MAPVLARCQTSAGTSISASMASATTTARPATSLLSTVSLLQQRVVGAAWPGEGTPHRKGREPAFDDEASPETKPSRRLDERLVGVAGTLQVGDVVLDNGLQGRIGATCRLHAREDGRLAALDVDLHDLDPA